MKFSFAKTESAFFPNIFLWSGTSSIRSWFASIKYFVCVLSLLCSWVTYYNLCCCYFLWLFFFSLYAWYATPASASTPAVGISCCISFVILFWFGAFEFRICYRIWMLYSVFSIAAKWKKTISWVESNTQSDFDIDEFDVICHSNPKRIRERKRKKRRSKNLHKNESEYIYVQCTMR